ncbi:MAG: 50S ribosomal protein L23 [Deltaproteobacteria bacterium]|nr:50S ribosomal protein L23 [Deltaproteobacteria bacterium]
MRSPYDILRKPRITEKGSLMAEAVPTVVFEVPLDANKSEIENAVRSVFNVDVEQVRTMIVRGKVKRRGRHIGKRSNWKKAIVTLAEGSEIDFFGSAV